MNPPRKTRDQIARKKTYRPPSVLQMPDNIPDDVEYRWIRTSIRNEDDVRSMSGRRRDGWVAVRQDEHPDYDGPAIEEGKYAGVLGIGDVVLMKNSKENNDARREYYSGRTDLQQDAIDNDLMREQSSAMPTIFKDRTTTTSAGSLRKKSFDD